MLAVSATSPACIQERWDPGPYRFCRTEAQCRSNESCIEVRSASGDGGESTAGICTTACTVSSLSEAVYDNASYGWPICVGIDANGRIDTTTLGGPGWYLDSCGSDHFQAGLTEYPVTCTPFDYGGYPIDLWIPTP